MGKEEKSNNNPAEQGVHFDQGINEREYDTNLIVLHKTLL